MRGLVLKRIEFEETSFIITVLTCEGYLSLIVKGAKRKNSLKLGLCEPLTLIEFEKTRSNKMPTLTEGSIINDYCLYKNDLELLSIASVVIEYAYVIKELDVYPDKIMNLVLDTLDEIKDYGEVALFRFETILASELGCPIIEEFIKEKYESFIQVIPSLVLLLKGELNINREVLRRFFIEYYKNELGIKIKSKKMYLEII